MPQVRDRVRQIFQYLEALVQQRYPAIRQIADQPFSMRFSEMPDHEAVRYTPDGEYGAPLLVVKRPRLIKCPKPNEEFSSWLNSGWDIASREASVVERKPTGIQDLNGDEIYEAFANDDIRVRLYEEWKQHRAIWVEERLRAEAAQRVFEVLYEQFAYLEREGGQVELAVGDGFLNWRVKSGGVAHPLLTKRVELIYDEQLPAFKVIDTDQPSELYNALLLAIEEVDIRRIQERTKELKESQYHPLGGIDTQGFLKAVVQSVSPTDGVFLESNPRDGEKSIPRMWREPILYARKRTTSYSTAIEAILRDIEVREEFPQSLSAIAGLHEQGFKTQRSDVAIPDLEAQGGDLDLSQILLAKEANQDQISIIKRLAQSGRVHVQGPPGTGKTHTIGNIIGHLLALGKRILITSHTEKALRVLKNQVPTNLQNLCVPVLSGDSETRQQLDNAINGINQRLTRDDPEQLIETAKNRFADRESLLREEQYLKGQLRNILDSEYSNFEIDGSQIEPAVAAREVAATKLSNDWIPGWANINDPLPLSNEELTELYCTNSQLAETDEIDLEDGLTEEDQIPTPERMETLIAEYKQLLGKDLDAHKDYWRHGQQDDHEILEQVGNTIFAEFSEEYLKLTWRPAAIVAGINGGQHKDLWHLLCKRIERAVDYNQKVAALAYLSPTISKHADIDVVIDTLTQIQLHLEDGKSLSYLTLLVNTSWKRVLQEVSVSAGKPHRIEHFQALILSASLRQARLQIKHLWNDLIAGNGGTEFDDLGDKPELRCSAIVREIRRALTWYTDFWKPSLNRLQGLGFDWAKLEQRVPRELSSLSDYLHIAAIVTQPRHLPEILVAELSRRRMKVIEADLTRVSKLFNAGSLGERFHSAVLARDSNRYRECYIRLAELRAIRPIYEKRKYLLSKLHARNPEWARQIKIRQAPHDKSALPGNVSKAWRWKRLNCQLDKVNKEAASDIQERLEKVQKQLRTTTLELVENLAWGRQVKLVRRRPQVQQFLNGWHDLQRRLQSERNKTIRTKMAVAAQRALAESSTAVPVWIMPLHAVAESFDPGKTRFDIVIIDEASQANLMALIPLYMANEAIIVGDHEQTSPEVVGVERLPIQNLIDVHLQGIPNSELFDLLTSIYDVAKRSFGNSLMLTEHFRCIPDIIGFSNKLSYGYKIKPLRERYSSLLEPPTVAYKVNGSCMRKKNEVEAETISKLLEAMTRHESYKEKTIGVIAMLGDEQAKLIDSKVRSRLGAAEYKKRRIVCGTPPQFQGDERDVIFLSLVDSVGEEETDEFLARKGDGAYQSIKKRFNVAASRARDQLWVVHSMDPDLNLKPGDIRRELISFARNPALYIRDAVHETGKAESIFEKLVYKDLIGCGYRVVPQWAVGYYRIDMVVVGERDRLAIECDGDRYHGPDKRDQDLERQAVLERLGWKFVRIRGTSFFRDPKPTMGIVYEKLERLGIEKLGIGSETFNGGNNMALIAELERLSFIERFTNEEDRQDGPTKEESNSKHSAADEEPVVSADGKDDEIMLRLATQNDGLFTREDLIKKTIYSLGFKRAGNLLYSRIGKVFTKLRRKGIIELDEDGLVHLNRGSSSGDA